MTMEAVMKEIPSILLVEDDDVDTEAVARALKKAGLSAPLLTAADGIEALNLLADRSRNGAATRPCIVLLDINMPRMNGLEFLTEMRKDDVMKRNVVFMLTTSARPQDKTAAYGLQAAGYILKENLGDLAGFLVHYCSINEFPE
jgi:CheY-like chemotaxis protein